jgi:hypothetical protein
VWAKIEYTKTFSPITAEHFYEFMKQEMELLKRKVAVRAATQLSRYYNRMTIIKSDVGRAKTSGVCCGATPSLKEKSTSARLVKMRLLAYFWG